MNRIKAAEATFHLPAGTVTVLVSCSDELDTTVAVIRQAPILVRWAFDEDAERTYEILDGGQIAVGVAACRSGSGEGVEDLASRLGFSLPCSPLWIEHY